MRRPVVLAFLTAALAALPLAGPAAAQVVDSTAADTTRLRVEDAPAPDTLAEPAPPVLAPAAPPTGPVVTLGLGDALAAALRESPEVAAAEARAASSGARYGLARASRFLTEFTLQTAHSLAPGVRIPDDYTGSTDALYLDPRVRNDWGKLRPFSRVEVEALQPILTWGELAGNLDAARHGAASDAAATDAVRTTAALRFVETYYGLLLAGRLDALTREAEGLTARAVREVDALIAAGDTTVENADLYEAQLAEQEVARRAVEAREGLATARSALARQLFLPEGTAFAPADTAFAPIPFVRDSLGVYVARALGRRAEPRQAREGVRARDALVRVARSAYYPKLGVGVTVRYSLITGRYRQPSPYIDDPFLGHGVQVGLGLRQNLNVAQTRARVAQAAAQADETRALARGAEQLVRFEVEEAYRALVVAEAALNAQRRAFEIARAWLLEESINADLGVGSARGLVRAVRARLTAEGDYLSRVERYNVAVARLLARTGTLPDVAARGTLVE